METLSRVNFGYDYKGRKYTEFSPEEFAKMICNGQFYAEMSDDYSRTKEEYHALRDEVRNYMKSTGHTKEDLIEAGLTESDF